MAARSFVPVSTPTPKPLLPFSSSSSSSTRLHKTLTHISPPLLNPHPIQILNHHRSLHSPIAAFETNVAAFETDVAGFEFESNGEPPEVDSTWEGAVLYRRNASVTHLEYCTTLERLGLSKISTNLSRSTASEMGMRVVQRDPSLAGGTPVLLSVDVTRKRRKLLLNGILRTVISLSCARCGQPAAKSVFSNFSLVLTEEPIPEESLVIDLSSICEKERNQASFASIDEEDAEESMDLDDWLYFPPEEKVIDISKNIRDMVHLEITIDAVCGPTCRGSINSNSSRFQSNMKLEEKGEYGTHKGLKKLKQMMQQR